MKVNEISAEGFLDMIGSNEAMTEKEPEPVQEVAPESSAEGFLEMFGHYDGQAVDAVTKEDPERALRVNRAATELNIPNAEVAIDLDAAEKKIERNKVGELINDSPKFTGFLARNANAASMFKNDLEIYTKAEKALAKFGVEQNEEGELEQLAMTETSLDIARAKVSKNINLGWASGSATVELGNLYYKWSQGEVTYDEIKDREAELQKIIQERKDSDSYIAATADTLGMMFKTAENFSVEHMGAAGAVGAAYVKAAQLVPGVGQALKALALAGSFGSMYKIEKGFMYADSIKQGATHEEAYKASEATGLVNAGVESANFAFIGKAFGPLLKYFKAKNVIQSAGALTAPTARKVIADSVKAAVVGTGSEVSTEVIQEFVNVAGEAWLNETAGTDFDLSYDAIEDRMIETAYDTFRGTVLLSGLGMTTTITAGIKKVRQAEKTQQFFADLHEEMKQSEVVKNAPEVASEAVQEMAEGSGIDTVYVDAYELQQVMTEANVSADQLELAVPGIIQSLEQKAINREDVEIPVGTYAAKIAGTDFGVLMQQHVRLRPDDISAAEAVKVQREQQNMMRGILDGTVDDTAIEGNISRFEGVTTEEVKSKESALKAIREQIAQAKGEEKKQLQASAAALRSEIREAKKAIALQYKAEYDKLKKQYAEQIKAADVEGKKKDADIAHEAKYGAWLVVNLARRAGLSPERIAELAPSVGVRSAGEGYNAIDAMAMKKRSHSFDEQIKKWRNGDLSEPSFDLGEPSWVLQIFGVSKDLPLVAKATQMFHVLHKKGEKTKVNFKNYRGVHGLTDEELQGILVAIQQPIAVFQSATMPDSIVLATELKRRVIEQKVADKKGNSYLTTVKVIDKNSTPKEIAKSVERNIVVPITLRATNDGIEVVNDIASMYEKNEFPADWFSKYLLGYDAKKGPAFIAQGLGSTSSPAQTGPSSKVIVYQNETSVGDLYQVTPKKVSFDDSLVTLHNITENGLLKTDSLGALPAPSIAVSKASSPLQNFGEITLVGTKDLADPKKNPVFSVDAYTARFPKLDWSKSAKKEEARKLRREVELAQEQVGKSAGDTRVTYYIYYKPDRDEAIEKLSDSSTGAAMFLNHKGIKFKPVMRKDDPSRIDEWATADLVLQKARRFKHEFDDYIAKRVSEAFDEPRIVDGNKSVPLTLDNVVRAMTRGPVRGAERGVASNSPGAIRARASKQYSSMEEMQADRDRVVSRDESYESEKQVDAMFDDFIASVREFWGYDDAGYSWTASLYLEGATNALSKVASKPTNASLKRALQNEGFKDISDEVLEKGVSALKAAKQVLTDYLEVKPQRAVSFSEFAGAVVPNTISEEARSVLEKAGLQIQTYNPKTNGARTRAQHRLIKRLHKERGDILYQENKDMARGTFSAQANVISLTPNADLSTFAHEMGHWYLETLFAIYGETTSASIRSDVEVMLKDFGLKSIEEWKVLPFEQREVLHERFAFYVEQYLAEGKAPTKESEGFFNRFGKWLLDVYKRFAGGPGEELNAIYRERFGIELPPMSDEVRRVLDRMIASENAMKTAEQAEGIQFLFEQKPEDMSDEEWERYLQDRDEAEAEATNKVYKRMARDEKWYKNARSKKLKEIQAQAEEIRSVVRDKVEKEVSEMPASKVFEMVTKNGLKISEKSLKDAGFDSVTIEKLKKAGCVVKDGMAVDAVRQLASAVKGYRNNRQFVADLLKMADRDVLIDDITTKRCLKNYSETFDQKKIDSVIADALHGEARGRAIATELSYLANDKQGRSRIYREAARRAAKQMVAGMPIGSVTVRKFLNAESRAAQATMDAMAKGDRYAAVMAKRAQLVNHEAALIAIDLEKKKSKLGNIRTTVFKGDKKLAKTRDIDVINVIRYVLTNMGLGKGVALEGDERKAQDYVKKLAEYDPEKFTIFDAIFKRYPYRGQVNFNALPVSAVLDLIDDVQVLYMQSREAKVVMLEGKRIDREEVVGELLKQFNSVERKPWDGGIHGTAGGDKSIAYRWMGIKSVLVRVESWCRAMDGGKNGPFFNYIFLPIANAASKFRNENTRVHEEMLKILKPMIDKWSKVRDIYFDEVGYMFTSKADLIGAILHTGNLSNKYKMLLGGRGDGAPWATKVVLPDGTEIVDTSAWDNFIARMMQDGVVTKEDMDAVQAIWDLTESMKPAAQAAYKKMYGTYFEEVEASEVVTPFGTYRGGYVPAVTDRLLVPEEETKAETERITQQDFVSQMPVHEPGFSKTRVPNYTKPLAFDLGLLCGHMQNVLKFSYIGPVAQEVAKILYDREFKSALDAIDPTWVKDMLAPWLKRSYEQTIGDGKTSLLDRTANKLRSIAGMNIMAGHVVNALQQTTGLTIAATKVDPKYMGKALVNLFSREASLQEMTEMSEFMKARIKDRAIEYQSKIERIARTPEYISQAKGLGKLKAADAKLDPLRDMTERHAYCFQVAMQAPVDCIVWFGAYMQALDQGMAQNQAIAEADSVVRTTLSDFAPENVAAVETGSAIKRCFFVFYNYFGMQLNLLGERWEGTKQTKKYGKFALDAVLIVWIPSVLAEIIMQMIYGFDTGDDDEFDLYDGLRLIVGPFFKNVFAMVPFLGGVVNTYGSHEAKKGEAWAKFIWGDDPFVGRAFSSPAFDMAESALKGVSNMIDLADEERETNARTATRNMLDLVSVATRLPVGALKKPLGYAAGVAEGDIEPESTLDVIQGLLSGKDTSK